MLLAAMFAYSNPTPIDVDIGFVRLERVSALEFAFVFGPLGYSACSMVALVAMRANETATEKTLRHAEASHDAARPQPKMPTDATACSPRSSSQRRSVAFKVTATATDQPRISADIFAA